MNGVVVSVLAALVTLVVVLLVLRFPRARGDAGDERVAAVTMDMRSRMDAVRRELGEAQAEAGRNRFLGQMAGAPDLQTLVRRALEAAGGLTGVDAALLHANGPERRRIVANLGLSAEETQTMALPGVPEGPEPRSVALSFRYDVAEDPAAPPVRWGLAVGLPGQRESVGQLAVFSRSAGPSFGAVEARQLEQLAHQIGPALENARYLEHARTQLDVDPITGLPHRQRFVEMLAVEVQRAAERGERLSLALLDLEDFGAINRRFGHEAGDAALREAAERAAGLVSIDDVLSRTGADEFAIVLRAAGLAEAEALCHRLRRALAVQPSPAIGRLAFSAAVAELDIAEDAPTFFQRAEEALAHAKLRGGVIVPAESWAFTESR